MGEERVWPYGYGAKRCPACSGSFAWWYPSLRWRSVEAVTVDGSTFLQARCAQGCEATWLEEPAALKKPSRSEDEIRELLYETKEQLAEANSEIERLRNKLAEMGGHRG